MRTTFIYRDEILGDIEIYPSDRCKSITLSLKYNNKLRVSYPASIDFEYITKFIVSSREKILKSREKMKDMPVAKQTIFTPGTQFATHSHKLVITPVPDTQYMSRKVTDEHIYITYPSVMPAESETLQRFIRKTIDATLDYECRMYIPQRINELQAKIGVRVSDLQFKNLKSRWGSCTSDNRITINTQIMRLPDELIDFILIHELCHILEHNHSKQFHALVNMHVNGREKEFIKEMKEYSTRLY